MLDALTFSALLFGAAIGVIVGRAWAEYRHRRSPGRTRVVSAPSYEALVRGRMAVRERFYVERRGVFVVEGEMLEGVVRRGMMLAVPYFESDDVLTGARVEGVERIDGDAGDARVLLGCTNDQEAGFWHELIQEGQTLDLLEYDPEV